MRILLVIVLVCGLALSPVARAADADDKLPGLSGGALAALLLGVIFHEEPVQPPLLPPLHSGGGTVAVPLRPPPSSGTSGPITQVKTGSGLGHTAHIRSNTSARLGSNSNTSSDKNQKKKHITESSGKLHSVRGNASQSTQSGANSNTSGASGNQKSQNKKLIGESSGNMPRNQGNATSSTQSAPSGQPKKPHDHH